MTSSNTISIKTANLAAITSALREIVGATPFMDAPVRGICADSRAVCPGDLFLALPGEHLDGHSFVAEAFAKGAIAAVVHRTWVAGGIDERLLLRVDSPLAAYQRLARVWRDQFTLPVVGITGSVGKTTTKEMVRAVLSTVGPVLHTPGNSNNEAGVPRALLRLRDEHRFAVIEMGMRGPGQIRELAEIAQPDIAVITNVGTAHMGLLGSREAIAKAKCELLECTSPGGVAILHADSDLLLETAASIWKGKTILFGLGRGDVCGTLRPDKRLEVDGHLFDLPFPGTHNALNFLAALAVARVLGVPWKPLEHLHIELPKGRARRIALDPDITLLDETYNAGLESMLAALELLSEEPCRRRFAVLGAMKELGQQSDAFHRQVGARVGALALDALWILGDGPDLDALEHGAEGVPTRRFSAWQELLDVLRNALQPGDRVLFKASRSVGLDRVVDGLSADAKTTVHP